jgi:hypothetical protein
MTSMGNKVLPTQNVSGSPGGREMPRMPRMPDKPVPAVPPMHERERIEGNYSPIPPSHKREFPNADV